MKKATSALSLVLADEVVCKSLIEKMILCEMCLDSILIQLKLRHGTTETEMLEIRFE